MQAQKYHIGAFGADGVLPDCKKGERIDCISAQEELEQALNNTSA